MALLSIRVLNIAMVLVGILLTGFLCTYLVVTSSDDALRKTKDSRRTSVGNAFAIGTESVENMTLELMDEVRDSTARFVVSFLNPHMIAAKSVAGLFLAANGTETHKYSFFGGLNSIMWNLFVNSNAKGMTGLGFSLDNRGAILMYEDETTVSRPADEYHYHGIVWNTGENSGSPVPGGLDRTMQADVIPYTGQPLGVPPGTDDNVIWNRADCTSNAIKTNGTVPNDPCKSVIDPKGFFYPLVNLIPSGKVMWTPPVSANYFIIIACIGSFVHEDWPTYPYPSGMTFAMLDLRQISKFLATINLGAYGRVYTTTRGNWLNPADVGVVTGVSRGSSYYWKGNVITARRPENSDDIIIKGTGVFLMDVGYEAVYKEQGLTSFEMLTDSGNETFYVKVGTIKNDEGIDWYVTCVIDKEYILGEIDANIEATQRDIAQTEHDIQSSLDASRINLYIILAAVALVLLLLSTLLVLSIISPLSALQREMALVAVMRLDEVPPRQSFSALSEVSCMQISFEAMIRNLREYRNYMPASVLQEDSGSDDECTRQESCNGSASSKTVTQSHSESRNSSGTFPIRQAALGNDARIRKVTLASANIIGFLESDLQKKMYLHGKYLSMCLLCAKECKGVPDGFSGDRFQISFNAVRQCTGHRAAGVRFGVDLLKHAKQQKLNISVAVTSGDSPCGNMGVETMKKFSHVGSLAAWLNTMQQIVSVYSAGVCVDVSVKTDAEALFFLRTVDFVHFSKHSKTPIFIYEIMDGKQVATEEWMYQLAGSERDDKYRAYNDAVALFARGEVEAARDLLRGFYSDQDIVTKTFIARFERPHYGLNTGMSEVPLERFTTRTP